MQGGGGKLYTLRTVARAADWESETYCCKNVTGWIYQAVATVAIIGGLGNATGVAKSLAIMDSVSKPTKMCPQKFGVDWVARAISKHPGKRKISGRSMLGG
uniref:Uncharacterized protein n=1 Tax=Romanomermis culicivorax TaxID=13658 RepID=A0A915IRZ2_ROMCU